MRILMATTGGGGDVIPFLAIGAELAARGHVPILAAGEQHRERIEERGIAFRPVWPHVSPDDDPLSRRARHPRWGPRVGIREVLMPALPLIYEDTVAAARDVDAVVSHPFAFAAPIAAEILGLPWISTVLAPITFSSPHDAPAFPMFPRLKRLEPLPGARRVLHRLYHLAMSRWTAPVDAFRADLGLAPRPRGDHSPLCALGLFSPAIAGPRRGLPGSARLTGFPFDDPPVPGDEDTERLESFLESGPPPVVFTLGTSVVRVAGSFYEESLAAARRAGMRAVLLVGESPRNRPSAPLGSDAVVLSGFPYHALFPRAAAIVHHGGIGTLGHALRAGRPMLVTPRFYDQPDNAYRAQRLGLARVMLYPRPYRAGAVARHLRALLDDPGYRARAEAIGAVVRQEDGVHAACDAIEAALRAGGDLTVLRSA